MSNLFRALAFVVALASMCWAKGYNNGGYNGGGGSGGGGGGSLTVRACSVPAQPNGTVGTIVYNLPAGTVAGDMLVAESTSVGPVTTIPSGFNLQANTSYGSGGVANAEVWTKLAGGSEPSTYTFSLAGNNMFCGALCAVFDSTGGALQIGAVQASGSVTGTNSFAATSVATTHNKAMVYDAWNWNLTNGNGITLPGTQSSAVSQVSAGAIAQAVGTLIQVSPGTIATQTATSGVATGSVVSTQVEIYSSSPF